MCLERVNGATLKTICSKPLFAERAWPRQIGMVKFVVDFAVEFLSLQAKGFRGCEHFGAFFAANDDGATGPLENHPVFCHFRFCFSPKKNFTAILSACICRRKFRRLNFSPRISPAKLLAPIFRRCPFSPAPFFAGTVFATLSIHATLENTNSALLPPSQKRQAKRPQATCTRPVITGESK